MAHPAEALTLEDLLADPMTIAVMRADNIDPVSFEAMLGTLAARLRKTGGAALHPRTGGAAGVLFQMHSEIPRAA